MAKSRVRFRNGLMGWNPSNDPEWRYRKTLDKKERDEFDAQDDVAKALDVQTWQQAGEPHDWHR